MLHPPSSVFACMHEGGQREVAGMGLLAACTDADTTTRTHSFGLKQTAPQSALVAAADVQPLALLFVSAVTACGWGLHRNRLDRVIPAVSLAIGLVGMPLLFLHARRLAQAGVSSSTLRTF